MIQKSNENPLVIEMHWLVILTSDNNKGHQSCQGHISETAATCQTYIMFLNTIKLHGMNATDFIAKQCKEAVNRSGHESRVIGWELGACALWHHDLDISSQTWCFVNLFRATYHIYGRKSNIKMQLKCDEKYASLKREVEIFREKFSLTSKKFWLFQRIWVYDVLPALWIQMAWFTSRC